MIKIKEESEEGNDDDDEIKESGNDDNIKIKLRKLENLLSKNKKNFQRSNKCPLWIFNNFTLRFPS